MIAMKASRDASTQLIGPAAWLVVSESLAVVIIDILDWQFERNPMSTAADRLRPRG
ncbi:hypothetical protein [Microlunatus parietis]|uniref:hypothetical protein n=1 Tax=Microlunatus parietis TaxID=682979 RepID=UPI0015C77AF3|nr:hypothetical protein [Microlunatus parietis]